MTDRRFGVSTRLYHDQRLTRDHLVHVAAHDFGVVELFATRDHFDYRDPAAIAGLREWLADTRLALHSVHAPTVTPARGNTPNDVWSIAARDDTRRRAAVAEVEAAIAVAASIPFRYLILHLGTPARHARAGEDNHPDAARRSLETITAAARTMGVRVALEVGPNPLSTPEALVQLIEDRLDDPDVGICLDYGHARLMGDLGDAIETLSGHLWSTHLHDNRGARDEHLVPFAGTIDWSAAMMATQKIGYDGVLMFEVEAPAGGDPAAVLERCAKARGRLEKEFITF